jgi:hypothetical protein
MYPIRIKNKPKWMKYRSDAVWLEGIALIRCVQPSGELPQQFSGLLWVRTEQVLEVLAGHGIKVEIGDRHDCR